VLLISVLDALRPSFEDNGVSRLVVFCCVVARSTQSFSEPSSVWALCCYLARRSTEFIGSCKICNFMPFDDIVIKNLSLFLSPFFHLSAFEYHLGCFWSIQVLLWRTITSSMNFVHGEFFMNCAICNNSAMA
jgi:hypothetical protein